MATTSNVEVTISLSEPDLDDDKLQAEAENLLPQIREVDGIEEANLVTLEEAPTGSKAVEGFSVGQLIALVNLKNVGSLFSFLGGLGHKPIKVVIKKSPLNEEITLEATNREDFELALEKVANLLNKR